MRVDALYSQLNDAPIVVVNGNPTKELINVGYRVFNGQEFFTHQRRGFKLDYIKREIDWYVKGNRWDTSITKHAKIWQGCIGKDGGINSNYGQYLFGRKGQLVRVYHELKRDTFSRRAVAMVLGQHDQHWSGVDQPCTVSLQFLIRPGRRGLELTVIATMRSQDAIFGLSNDVPAFMFIGKVMASALGLELGALFVNVGSLHVYERHFDMVNGMAGDDFGWYNADKLPDVTRDESAKIILENKLTGKMLEWINQD